MKVTNATFTLPEEYRLLREIDLQKNKKLAVLVNVGALVIALPLFLLGLWLQPPFRDGELILSLPALLVALFGMVAYLFLHEWVHGIFIRHYCGKKAEYGFTGLYAFAGRKDAYFAKRPYLVISLAPVVLWGAALLILNLLCGPAWFWTAYLIQIINLSGAAGDLYVTALLLRMPAGVLVNDDGVSMRFYG